MAQEDPGSLAETFSAGVQYIRGVFGGAEDERLAKLEAKLDLSKITERVYAMGAPQTKKPTDPKKNRNNVTDIAEYLNAKCPRRYLVANFSRKKLSLEVCRKLDNQVVELSWDSGSYTSQTPPLPRMFEICYALQAWLRMDERNVVAMCCENGKTRTGVVASCFMLFSGQMDSCLDAFHDFFCKRVNKKWKIKDIVKTLPMSLQRYLNNFSDLVSLGAFPNTQPLLLERVLVQNLPVMDAPPCIDVWSAATKGKVWPPKGGHRVASAAGEQDVEWDPEDGTLCLRMHVVLDGDFMLVCRLPTPSGEMSPRTPSGTSSSSTNQVLFRYSSTNGFLAAGPLQLAMKDLDMYRGYKESFDKDNFSVTLIFAESGLAPCYTVARFGDRTGEQCACAGVVHLSAAHCNRSSLHDVERLTDLGHEQLTAVAALQLCNGDLDRAMNLMAAAPLKRFMLNNTDDAQRRVHVRLKTKVPTGPGTEGDHPLCWLQEAQAPPEALDAPSQSHSPTESPVVDSSSVTSRTGKGATTPATSSSADPPHPPPSPRLAPSATQSELGRKVVTRSLAEPASPRSPRSSRRATISCQEPVSIATHATPSRDGQRSTPRTKEKRPPSRTAALVPSVPAANAVTDVSTSELVHRGGIACAICGSDDVLRQAQLIRCTACALFFHTDCVGAKRIPFKLTSKPERKTRDLFINKMFSKWSCGDCSSKSTPDTDSAESSRSHIGIDGARGDGSVVTPTSAGKASASPARGSLAVSPRASAQTEHSSGARAVAEDPGVSTNDAGGGDTATGRTESDILASERIESRRHTSAVDMQALGRISRVASSPAVSTATEESRGEDAETMALVQELQRKGLKLQDLLEAAEKGGKDKALSVANQAGAEGVRASDGSGSGVPSTDTPAQANKAGSPSGVSLDRADDADQRIVDADQSARVLTVADTGTTKAEEVAVSSSPSGAAEESRGVQAECGSKRENGTMNDPSNRGGISAQPVATAALIDCKQSGVAQELWSRRQMEEASADETRPEGELDRGKQPAAPLKKHSKYAKYFKMLAIGLPKATVLSRMQKDGADPRVLDMDPELPFDPMSLGGADSATQATKDAPPTAAATGVDKGKGEDKLGAALSPRSALFAALKSKAPSEAPTAPAVGVDESKEEDKPGAALSPRSALFSALKSKAPSAGVSDVSPSAPISPQKGGEAQDAPKLNLAAAIAAKAGKLKPEAGNGGEPHSKQDEGGAEEIGSAVGVAQAGEGADGGGGVPIKEMPEYAKYFKMLKMGLPKGAVQNKMMKDDLDPAVLDLDPNRPLLPVKDMPEFAKYFKMLKMGLPKGAVKHKMLRDNLNADVLDMDPNKPLLRMGSADGGKPTVRRKSPPKLPKKRRKKLHWTAVADDAIEDDSVWATAAAELGGDGELDLQDLDDLFTKERESPRNKKKAATSAPGSARKAARVQLLDGKRAMNMAIALSRIKLSNAEVKHALLMCDASKLELDQVQSLRDCMPQAGDNEQLKSFKGDPATLGEAEKFLLELVDAPEVARMRDILEFMLRFPPRARELREQLRTFIAACDDVKMSKKLRVILGVVLKVGNQLNQGGKTRAFTLDSLLKLSTTKAFDNKTTVLDYLVKVVMKHQGAALDFKSELCHVQAAQRMSLLLMEGEANELEAGLDAARTAGGGGERFDTFVRDAGATIGELRDSIAEMKTKFAGVLRYMAEAPDTRSEAFFTTLCEFIAAFDRSHAEVSRAAAAAERARRRAEAAEKKEKERADKLRKRLAGRRASVV